MSEKDYLNLILHGFIGSHDYLESYFVRECKKASDQKIEQFEFFNRCIDVTNKLKLQREKDYSRRKEDLEIQKRIAEKNKLDVPEIQETLDATNPETYPLDISRYGDNFSGFIYQADIDFINEKLLKAAETNNGNNNRHSHKRTPSIDAVKLPAKFYALYHWIKIEMGIENTFAKNDNGQFLKSEIEIFVKNSYPNCPSSQSFYRSFKDLDITNKTAIANSFGRGYKEKLITISNNDNKLITHLKNYPN